MYIMPDWDFVEAGEALYPSVMYRFGFAQGNEEGVHSEDELGGDLSTVDEDEGEEEEGKDSIGDEGKEDVESQIWTL